jgi:2-methylisocitrate lyase-like PEP mutase family enzyme
MASGVEKTAASGRRHQINRIEKTARFRELHRPGDPVVMPNPWDLGSTKVMAYLGAKALATTSSGFGFTVGLADGGLVDRDTALAHAARACERRLREWLWR